MNLLNNICAYWYECIKNEDIFEKDISINVRSKAILYPFDEDHFIFEKNDRSIQIDDPKLHRFAIDKAEGLDFYYGFPLLFYFDATANRHLVAPLLIIKVRFSRNGNALFLSKDEPLPACGIQALSKLGLRTEEIADINQSIEAQFLSHVARDKKDIARMVLEIIQREAEILLKEDINPAHLSNSKKLTKDMTPGLYNKSIIFAGESSVFNIHLIKDLLELKNRNDLEKTALSFLTKPATTDAKHEKIPILPFPSNEYQLSAIQDIFRNSLTVITGPPGTGKSQFISNLIINLFLDNKTVLFVSHTGEAVDVVNSKINEQFSNLMLRTGKKALRQELKGKFNELHHALSRTRSKTASTDYIHSLWRTILSNRDSLVKRDELEAIFQQYYLASNELANTLQTRCGSLIQRIQNYFKNLSLKLKLRSIKAKLERLPDRHTLESKVRELERKYYIACQDFIRNIYISRMLGNNSKTGRVNAFLNQVTNQRFNDAPIDEAAFINALQVLRIWSSTLKSLRGTFPLKPSTFDYVIFDEASQIDLPSAAPALYRAKKAIVVGDPMQLTHIAGITKNVDFGLAKVHGLTNIKDIYPAKIRYCDVSLYKAAENSLSHPPILLTNHYRSEDQIISLCNQVFYKGRLKILSTLNLNKFPSTLPLGVQWIDVKGEVLKHLSGSRVNEREAIEVLNVFQNVLKKIEHTDLSIGIVTPYSGQRKAIYDKISSSVTPELLEKHDVKILTAHQFQGSEKDIVIFSLVLSSRGNGSSDRWYNIYPQILNVALSRARYLLYIVGDKPFCKGKQGILGKICAVYEKIKAHEQIEKYDLQAKFDTPAERMFYEAFQKVEIENSGYKFMPKLVVKRYTLDFAIIGQKKIDVEIDGPQHEIIEGMPVLEDVERDEFLRKEGWEIMRFPNYRILSDMPNVINELLVKLK